jgi:hypothetical protein
VHEGRQKGSLDTLAIHEGQAPGPTTRAIMTPLYQTATYLQPGERNNAKLNTRVPPLQGDVQACHAVYLNAPTATRTGGRQNESHRVFIEPLRVFIEPLRMFIEPLRVFIEPLIAQRTRSLSRLA